MDFTFLSTILDPILNAGPLFMIFIVFSVIGLVVKLGPVKAIRNGLMIAVGFNGVYIVVDYFLGTIAPAATALAERFGGVFTYTDIGWAAYASFAWSSPWAYLVVVLSLAVNLLMIFTNMTETLNLNIWDFWEAIIAFLTVYVLTDNIVAGLIFATFLAWFNLMMSDFNAQRGYCADLGFEGLSFYQGTNVAWGAFGHYVGKLLDKTNLKQARFTPEYVQEKFGVIGEPAVLGGIIGLLMGIGAGYYWIDIIMLMISLATALVLIPMMSGIVMSALVPVSEAAGKFMKEKAGGRQLYIGVDPAIAVGNTTVLAATILMVPILMFFAFVIPGTVNMPLADLPSLLFFWVFVVAPNRLDMVRTMIVTSLVGLYGTLAGILVAPWMTKVAVLQGVEVAEGTGVTSWFCHLCPELLVAGLLGENFDVLGIPGLVAFCAVVIGITIYFRIRYLKRVKAEELVTAAA